MVKKNTDNEGIRLSSYVLLIKIWALVGSLGQAIFFRNFSVGCAARLGVQEVVVIVVS